MLTVKLQDYEVRVGVKVTFRVRTVISAGALKIEFCISVPGTDNRISIIVTGTDNSNHRFLHCHAASPQPLSLL